MTIKSEKKLNVAAEWFLRVVSSMALIYTLFLIAQHQYLVYSLGDLSAVSLGSVGALFILGEYSFSSSGEMKKLDAIVFAILFCAAFLWIYEIIYHFSFPITTTIGGTARYLATSILPVIPLVLLRSRLTWRKISGVIISIFALVWILWLLYGFPQYYYEPLNWYVYSPQILKTRDPWDTSLFFNFGSKTILTFFFASILKISYVEEARNLGRRAVLSLRHVFFAT